jgi:hypothetical protein
MSGGQHDHVGLSFDFAALCNSLKLMSEMRQRTAQIFALPLLLSGQGPSFQRLEGLSAPVGVLSNNSSIEYKLIS